jgi:DNA repair exonuclease SbcCD ATPase subunit
MFPSRSSVQQDLKTEIQQMTGSLIQLIDGVLTCPISLDHYVKPTLLRDTGYIFEYEQIKAWLLTYGTCPMTRKQIKSEQEPLIPVNGIRAEIETLELIKQGVTTLAQLAVGQNTPEQKSSGADDHPSICPRLRETQDLLHVALQKNANMARDLEIQRKKTQLHMQENCLRELENQISEEQKTTASTYVSKLSYAQHTLEKIEAKENQIKAAHHGAFFKESEMKEFEDLHKQKEKIISKIRKYKNNPAYCVRVQNIQDIIKQKNDIAHEMEQLRIQLQKLEQELEGGQQQTECWIQRGSAPLELKT